MNKILTIVANLLTAVAVAAPTANEDFVLAEDAQTYTNAVRAAKDYTAQTYTNAVRAAKDYTDAKVAAATPADYANVSNLATSAVQPAALAPFVRSDKDVNDTQEIGGTLAPFGLWLPEGWGQLLARNGRAVAQGLPDYIAANQWGFATSNDVSSATSGLAQRRHD